MADYLPKKEEIQGRYIEPFIGGGAVLFYIQPEKAIASDLNNELIELYEGIKGHPLEVWETFKNFPRGKEAYYKIRDEDLGDKALYYRAARTLYLNRTCFKGMWRHNPGGKFNVGYGGEDRRCVTTYETLKMVSDILRAVTILQADFEGVLDLVDDGDFIFLDPPYKPGAKEMIQAHYINGHFTYSDQIRLANKIKRVSKEKQIRWIMTNSSNPDIVRLYKDFSVINVPVGTSGRIGIREKHSKEILISNS